MSMWESAEDDAAVLEFSQVSARQIREQTEALGLSNNFTYLGDSAQGQLPFGSYANGTNLATLEAIRSKYDPEQFFKSSLHRGFPLA